MKYWFGDDDTIALFIARKYCQIANLDGLFFDSAEELLEAVSAVNNGTLGIPDLIVLDLYMWTIETEQVVTVPFFVQFIEKHNITLVIISASIDKGDEERVESLPYVHSFFTKPLTKRLLEKILTCTS